ncbi:hypothetical protein Ciccas_011486 [Cichlidogyrus casuarinus]|uniref:Uncharacterized protein n=1 Tax=Cichlidogyrus casuarinus TaxID=1844966 RepID=A0ABD2PR42_9PLAT
MLKSVKNACSKYKESLNPEKVEINLACSSNEKKKLEDVIAVLTIQAEDLKVQAKQLESFELMNSADLLEEKIMHYKEKLSLLE